MNFNKKNCEHFLPIKNKIIRNEYGDMRYGA